VSILVAAAVGVLTLSILPVSAQDSQSGATLGALPEVEFSQLSQRDPNPLGEKALAIHADQWKHAETEHFIYHFVHSYVAAPVSVEAEFHYRVVAKELEREQPTGERSPTSTFSNGRRNGSSFKRSANWNRGPAESIRREVSSSSAIRPTNSPAIFLGTRLFISSCIGSTPAAFPVGSMKALRNTSRKLHMRATSAPAVTSPSRIHRRSRRKTLFPSPHSSPSLIRLPIA
jgi:hypothetical protein